MQITLKGELAVQVLHSIASDRALARSLAEELLRGLDLTAQARLLLAPPLALQLLHRRLQLSPRKTLAELRQLAAAATRAPTARGAKARRRHRLTQAEVMALKQRVVSFLRRSPWSNRKQISSAASIPTPAIYNRLMGELRRERQVVARGKKSKAVYATADQQPRRRAGKGGRDGSA